jgi:hypothetical protein
VDLSSEEVSEESGQKEEAKQIYISKRLSIIYKGYYSIVVVRGACSTQNASKIFGNMT